MFQDLVEKTKYELQHWSWEKKKKEIKQHYYKYRFHYALATILILIIVIIEEQNVPIIMIGGGEENTTIASEPKQIQKTNVNNTPKNKESEASNGNEPKKAKDNSDFEGNELISKKGNSNKPEMDNSKKSEKMKKGKNPFTNLGSSISGGLKGFGSGVFTMVKRIFKFFAILLFGVFIIIAPALLFLALVYLMFKLMIKGTYKM